MSPAILITGATRGIGLAAAKQLHARDATVIIGSRDGERAEAVATSLGGDVDWVSLDITSEESVQAAVSALTARHTHLDVLANNAAILLDHYESITDLKIDTLRETLETNVLGTLCLTQALQPLLERSTAPRVINVSSGAGQLEGEAQAWAPAYSISKTALNMLTQQLTAGLPDMMINAMCPGWCRTVMGGADAPRTAEEGADTLTWLALDAPHSLRGKFVKERVVTDW